MNRLRLLLAPCAFFATLAVVALPGAGKLGPEVAEATHYDRLLAPTTKCGGYRQTDSSIPTAEQEAVMRCLHNHARAASGRAALAESTMLTGSSDLKTADMLRCGEFSHNACGRATLYHVHRSGYTSSGCWGAGENIAWGSGTRGTPRAIMSAWLHSDPHRTNILNSRYREIGLGLRKGTFKGYSGASVWTAHLGYRC